MLCENCNMDMVWSVKGNTQGWSCPSCGWNVVTTYMDEIYNDITEYSVYIKGEEEIDKEKIKLVAQIARVNFINAKQILEGKNVCILKAKALEVKNIIRRLEEVEIQYNICPQYKY